MDGVGWKDILYSEEHHVLTKASGLQLALEGIFSCKMHALNGMATKCSSFVPLCQCQAQRLPGNDFLGDCSKQIVRDGNALMDVTALLYLLAFLVGNVAVVEQPREVHCLCARISHWY